MKNRFGNIRWIVCVYEETEWGGGGGGGGD